MKKILIGLFVLLAVPAVIAAKTKSDLSVARATLDTLSQQLDTLIQEVRMARTQSVQPQAPKLGSGFGLSTCGSGGGISTTSLTYVTTSASSTFSATNPCNAANAESIDLNIVARGSSTAAVMQFEVQFSDNNIDWYSEDCKSVDSTVRITHGQSPCNHFISLVNAGNASTTKNITITPTASPFIRVIFGASGANYVFHAQRVEKDPFFR